MKSKNEVKAKLSNAQRAAYHSAVAMIDGELDAFDGVELPVEVGKIKGVDAKVCAALKSAYEDPRYGWTVTVRPFSQDSGGGGGPFLVFS